MKDLILNQGVNWLVIYQDGGLIILLVIFLCWMAFRINFSGPSESHSRTRYEQTAILEKQLSDARTRIAVLSIANELQGEQLSEAKAKVFEANCHLSEAKNQLHEVQKQVRKRNEKGQYVKG